MIQKRVLVARRVRRPPSTGWSWTDRRFVRDQASLLSREAMLLYFFLAAVCDGQGVSFYGDAATAALLRMPLALHAKTSRAEKGASARLLHRRTRRPPERLRPPAR
jgi:hypothetical protein